MKDLRQYGIGVMTLTDLVDDFCLAQGNMRESVILAQYRHARWAWKDIFRTTLWEIRKAVLEVDCHNQTIRLPDDCERVINFSVVDCFGRIHALGFNTDLNTAEIKCLKTKCSCTTCGGQDTLCAAVDSISAVTSTVTINGTGYTQTILTRYNGAGAVQTQTTTPTLNVDGQVVYITDVQTLCNVETTERGCIAITQPNMAALSTYCGAGNFINEWGAQGFGWGNINQYRELIPAPYNYWGEWNYNAADRQIVHIFGGAGNHFNNNNEQEQEWRGRIRQVILDYQTNGETPNTEILIPQYAVEAVEQGMFYRQKRLNPRMGAADRQAAKFEYNAAKSEVNKYLNPVIMDNIAKLQTNPRLW